MENPKAHVDLATGQIYGCEKGTFKWFHEEGHLAFNSSPDTSFLILVQEYAFMLWMPFIMLSFVSKAFLSVSGLLWAVHIGITLYEERWCNQYARRKLNDI